jgi:hypothetical protein
MAAGSRIRTERLNFGRAGLQKTLARDTFVELCGETGASRPAKKGAAMNPITFQMNFTLAVGRGSTMVLFYAESHVR